MGRSREGQRRTRWRTATHELSTGTQKKSINHTTRHKLTLFPAKLEKLLCHDARDIVLSHILLDTPAVAVAEETRRVRRVAGDGVRLQRAVEDWV